MNVEVVTGAACVNLRHVRREKRGGNVDERRRDKELRAQSRVLIPGSGEWPRSTYASLRETCAEASE